MNIGFAVALCAVCSYLIGGLNPSITLSKAIYHKDIRELGSKNPGFTNFKRVFGGKWAWLVMVFDLGKSALLCTASGLLLCSMGYPFRLGAAAAGVFAILGHAFPVWYGFKGGKGFLAGAAAIWFIDWRAGLIALAVLLAVLLTTHYMSLADILAVLSAPVSVACFGYESIWILVCVSFSAVFITARHHSNIGRLIRGEEPRSYFKKKAG